MPNLGAMRKHSDALEARLARGRMSSHFKHMHLVRLTQTLRGQQETGPASLRQ
jgi:hypothetical protein